MDVSATRGIGRTFLRLVGGRVLKKVFERAPQRDIPVLRKSRD